MGRVAAITGAASEPGRAMARAYADAGWDVALIGRGWAGLEAAAADVRDRGRSALVLPVDVTDDAARQLAIGRIQDELGPVEAWVADGLLPRYAPRPARYPARSRRQAIARRASSWIGSAASAPMPESLIAPAAAAVASAVVLGVVVGARSRRH
ncbi:MAG TPA: SDR family NAD(P)-dependent oxidoreductase [Candidatus Limnocylindrales bacterium]|jgi:NAD(P)-dependent dehydrogenase (short-subunit alcohol dehydrogenase family)